MAEDADPAAGLNGPAAGDSGPVPAAGAPDSTAAAVAVSDAAKSDLGSTAAAAGDSDTAADLLDAGTDAAAASSSPGAASGLANGTPSPQSQTRDGEGPSSDPARATDAEAAPALPGGGDQLAARVNALGGLISRLGQSASQEDADALRDAFNAVGSEVDRASSQASGLATLLNDALQQGEKLASDNRELRRKQEDAVLDKQLKAAQNETEKLRVAGDVYKRELLQQKLSDTEWALSREQDRAKEAESEKDAFAATVKQLKKQLKAAGISENGGAAAPVLELEGPDAPMSAKEREELAQTLTAGEGDRRSVDAQALIAAAKGLRGMAALEQHLQQALQEKEKATQQVEELNDIVFSKTFKAPSAWADRERKYKMESHDWTEKARKLQARIEKQAAEIKRYRESNRTAEFEATAAELQRQVEAANAAKVAAQQEAHELRLKMRKNDGEFTSDGKRVPYKSPFRSTVSEILKIDGRPASAGATTAPEEASPESLPSSEVGATIQGLEKAGIRVEKPRTPRFEPGRTRISRGGPPLASPLASGVLGVSGSANPDLSEVLQGLNAEGVGRIDASPPDLSSRPSGDSAGLPEPASSAAGLVSQRRGSFSAVATRHLRTASGTSAAGSEASPVRRVTLDSAVPSSAEASPRTPADWQGGGVPATAMYSPAASPTRAAGAAAASGAAAGGDDDSGTAPAAQRPGSDAVWAGLGGDDGAAAASARGAPNPSARDSMDARNSEAGEPISARDRENMYRLYSHHVEAEDMGALKWQAAELSSRLEMMQAQLGKAALTAERAEEDKKGLEKELAQALEAAVTPPDQTALGSMQERLAGLVQQRGSREEEAIKRAREAEERSKAAQSALQAAHRQHQATEKRLRKLEKQLAAASTALGPAAAAALESAESGSNASGDDAMTPRREASVDEAASMKPWGWGDVGGVTEEDMEAIRLREENELLMEGLVRSKLEMAETQSDYVKTKRALIRAVEKQAEMSEKMDLLKAELELLDKGEGHRGDTTGSHGGGGFGSAYRDTLSASLASIRGLRSTNTPERKPATTPAPAAALES